MRVEDRWIMVRLWLGIPQGASGIPPDYGSWLGRPQDAFGECWTMICVEVNRKVRVLDHKKGRIK